MRRFFLIISIGLILILSLACGTGQDKAGEANPDATNGDTPPEAVTSGEATSFESVPETSTQTPAAIGPGGIPVGSAASDQQVWEFLEAVVTGDKETIKKRVTGELADKIDDIIADLGLHKYAESNDYGALWGKIKPLSNLAFTTVTGDEMLAIWVVMGGGNGLPDFQVQMNLMRVNDEWLISGYEVLNP